MGGFCKYCVMHDGCSSTEKAICNSSIQKVKKATGKDGALERRQKMQCHKRTLDTSVALIQSAQKQKKTLSFKNFHAKTRDV